MMMTKWILGTCVAVGLIAGISIAVGGMFSPGVPSAVEDSGDSTMPGSSTATASSTTGAEADPEQPVGASALQQASQADKYLFAMFWQHENEQAAAMKQVVARTAEMSEQADAVLVQVTNPAEREFVRQFRISPAQTPLILVIAPNGAVTGGFSHPCEPQDLLDAFTSPAMAAALLPLQEGRLVLLCVQNDSTDLNDEAMRGVRDFANDPNYGKLVEVVMLDPQDSAEKSFLRDLRIDPQVSIAMTALLLPPGSVGTVLEGETTKELLLAALQACGPGGCGPR
ncbi:MAG: hypothetical protein EA424_05035 [Planctomycetaceae bacterium]|nr:MAG: hypothetical protein EA424_05035 [Planctomycetaceae bacterium]